MDDPADVTAPPGTWNGYLQARWPKRVERAFSWLKSVAALLRTRHRGLARVLLDAHLRRSDLTWLLATT